MTEIVSGSCGHFSFLCLNVFTGAHPISAKVFTGPPPAPFSMDRELDLETEVNTA